MPKLNFDKKSRTSEQSKKIRLIILVAVLSLAIIATSVAVGVVLLKDKVENVQKLEFTTLELRDAEFAYDGEAHTLAVTGLPNNATVEYPLGNTFTEVGTYEIKAVVSAEGYNSKELSATMTIVRYWKITFRQPNWEDKVFSVRDGESFYDLYDLPELYPDPGKTLQWWITSRDSLDAVCKDVCITTLEGVEEYNLELVIDCFGEIFNVTIPYSAEEPYDLSNIDWSEYPELYEYLQRENVRLSEWFIDDGYEMPLSSNPIGYGDVTIYAYCYEA